MIASALSAASERIVRALAHGVMDLLPDNEKEWGFALLNESAAITSPMERVRFLLNGSLGLLRIAVSRALHGNVANPWALLTSIAVGVSIAIIDLESHSRMPLQVLLPTACIAFGFLIPAGSWRWGLVVGISLPVVVVITGNQGPYHHDGGDVWFPAAVGVVLSLAAGKLSEIQRRVRFKTSRC
jgi:hypothetical protein